VVIDWGLAKDLSVTDHDDGAEPYRSWSSPEHVTVAGTVLGTPAYMAPEQARGETGDERADVYALGAMLYSVLSGQTPYHGPSSAEVVKAVVEGPPPPLGQVAPGVAADLVAIVDAAMVRDADARMPSARMFADELRRYLQGQLVQSHRYTAAERALRWMRRHRELSAAIAVGAALLIVLGGLAVSRIVHERDDADQQRRRAEVVASDLILAHATLQLHTDPTAAWQTLQPYRGDDALRLQHLQTEALARGVALAAHNGHVDMLHTLVPLSADELLSAGEDRRMLVTSVVTGEVRTLATDVSAIVAPAVAPQRRRVAYAATSGEIRVVDLDTAAVVSRWPAPATPVRLAYDPAGEVLAIAMRGGAVAIHGGDRPTADRQVQVGAVTDLAFRNDRELVAIADGQLVQVDITTAAPASPSEPAAPASRLALLAPSPYAVSFGKNGSVTLHDLDARRVAARRHVCPLVSAVAYVAARRTLALACNDGAVRLWRLDALADEPRTLTVGTPLYDLAAASPADQLVAAGEDGVLHIVDIATGAITRLPGHPGAVYAVRAPSAGFPYAASGDVRGHLRIWPTRPIAHRTIHTSPVPVNLVYFSPDGRRLLSDSDDGTVHVWDLPSLKHTPLRAHQALAYGLRFSDTGKTFMSRATDGTARVWSLDSLTLVRDLVGHEDFVFDAEYLTGGDRVVTSSYDGRLFLWDTFSARRELLFQAPALASVEVSRTTDEIFIADATGTVHRIGRDRAVRPLVTTSAVNHMVMSPDSRTLMIGTPDGTVLAVEVATGASRRLLTDTGPVRFQAFDPASSLLAVIAENRTAHLLPLDGGAPVSFELDGLYAAFAPDGRTLAVACRDGAIRFYARTGRLLGVAAAHTAAVLSVRFSPDGRTVASSAMDGTVALTSVTQALGVPR
jgi:WD40 repeat protein